MLNKPTNYQQRTDPRSCAQVVYIAGDTLRHQPMGAGHMMVLQLRGPMAFHVLQWCHPMLAYHNEDKLLYPDDHLIWCSKVDSGPRKHNFLHEIKEIKDPMDRKLQCYINIGVNVLNVRLEFIYWTK